MRECGPDRPNSPSLPKRQSYDIVINCLPRVGGLDDREQNLGKATLEREKPLLLPAEGNGFPFEHENQNRLDGLLELAHAQVVAVSADRFNRKLGPLRMTSF